VVFHTEGYGGRKVREGVRIQTNDPNRPWLGVVVTGMVEKFAEIIPERIKLAGPANQKLFAEVEIIPRQDYPFTIREVKALSGRFFTYKTEERNINNQKRYIILVENTRTERGRYADTLVVQTDSTIRPEIKIHVIGTLN
jgi:hypothetical protein